MSNSSVVQIFPQDTVEKQISLQTEIQTCSVDVIDNSRAMASQIIRQEALNASRDLGQLKSCEWLSILIIHVGTKIRLHENRTASLRDVSKFASKIKGFELVLREMSDFDHQDVNINEEVKRVAERMLHKADILRATIHSKTIATMQNSLRNGGNFHA